MKYKIQNAKDEIQNKKEKYKIQKKNIKYKDEIQNTKEKCVNTNKNPNPWNDHEIAGNTKETILIIFHVMIKIDIPCLKYKFQEEKKVTDAQINIRCCFPFQPC